MRAVAVSADGKSAITGSFDTSAIRWSFERNAAEQVLRFHESAVNAVAILKDGRLATGGEDGKIAIWKPGEPVPAQTFEGHTAPIVSLAVSPDGNTIASASWDRTIRLWPLAGGAPRVLEGHSQNVNGVAFTSGRKKSRQRGLRRDGADLAARGIGIADHCHAAGGAQCGRARARRRDRGGGAPTAACSLSAPAARSATKSRRWNRRSSRSRSRRMARWSPPPASAARSRSSSARAARSRARWSGRDCRSGRSRSFPTIRRC